MSSFSEDALDKDGLKLLKTLFKKGCTTYDNDSKEDMSNFIKNFTMPKKPKMDIYNPGDEPPKRSCTPYILFTSAFHQRAKI